MKIFSPINEDTDIAKLVPLADEFYCGIIDSEWINHNPGIINFNTRGGSTFSNYTNLKKLESDIKCINENSKECFLTVNSHNYSSNQLPTLNKIVKSFKKLGGAGIICSDLNGVDIGIKHDLKVYLSTNFSLYNSYAISTIANEYDITRVILSRDISFEDITSIRKNTNVELEVFIEFFGCRFSNCACFATHMPTKGGMCKLSNDAEWEYSGSYGIMPRQNHRIYSECLLTHACGYCAIYDFFKIGIDSLKIVGRELNGESIYSSVKCVRDLMSLAKQSKNKNEYLQKSFEISFPDRPCINGYNCYYPELGRWNRNDNKDA